jgi:Trypsin-co-occurring domain 1
MAEIVEFAVEAGGVLRVQAVDGLDGGDELDLVPAAPGVRDVVDRATETLESALGQVTPALSAITERLRKLSPDEVEVEFGFVLSAEHGFIIAKASGEIHFNVTLTWKGNGGEAGTAQAGAAGDIADVPVAGADVAHSEVAD